MATVTVRNLVGFFQALPKTQYSQIKSQELPRLSQPSHAGWAHVQLLRGFSII